MVKSEEVPKLSKLPKDINNICNHIERNTIHNEWPFRDRPVVGVSFAILVKKLVRAKIILPLML